MKGNSLRCRRSERFNREKDGEINSFIIEVPDEMIRANKAITLEAVVVGVGAFVSKTDDVKGEVEGVDLVDNVNFLEIDGYVANESVKDVALGVLVNLSHEQSTGTT